MIEITRRHMLRVLPPLYYSSALSVESRHDIFFLHFSPKSISTANKERKTRKKKKKKEKNPDGIGSISTAKKET